MNKFGSCLAVVSGMLVLGTVSTARAEGFELGARVGYAFPMGKLSDQGTNNSLADAVSGMVPLQLDIGYRVLPSLMVGGYVMYGFGIVSDTIDKQCDALKALGADATCSAHDVRLGLQAQYHFAPKASLDPWLGAGIGYEWLTFGVHAARAGVSNDTSVTGKGFEFINLQGGVDFAVAPGLGLGPFLSFSVGQYGESSTSCDGAGCDASDSTSQDIDDKALHQWLTLGVRGTFVL